MSRRAAKIICWPYRPHLVSADPGPTLEHHGGSALAWVRIVVDGEAVTSVDAALVANSRLLLEQREVESA